MKYFPVVFNGGQTSGGWRLFEYDPPAGYELCTAGIVWNAYTDNTRSTVFTNYMEGDWVFANNTVDWTANGYRLPTEAEWEKAARGGRQGRLFPWGGFIFQLRVPLRSRRLIASG